MSWIHRLFRNDKSVPSLTLEYLKTDIHSHLIPGIDDGVQDIETAVELVRSMKELGFCKLVATPHIMADVYKNNQVTILQGLNNLRTAIHLAGIDIEIVAAAEYLADEGLLQAIYEQQVMTIAEKYLLIELPYFNPGSQFDTIIFEAQVAGYKPILAHPERYHYWHREFNKLEGLKERGLLFQLNIISLGGHYSHPTKKMAEKLIDAGMIDFLGSDLHGKHSFEMLRKTLVEPGLEKLLTSGKLMNHLI